MPRRKKIPEPGATDKLEPLEWDGNWTEDEEEIAEAVDTVVEAKSDPIPTPGVTDEQVEKAVAILTDYDFKSVIRFGDQDTLRRVVRVMLGEVIG
jgi:hypothetical protein